MWSKLKPFLLPAYFGFWVTYFAYFWSGLFAFDSLGNLSAGHVNVWGDWAAHFTMGSAMGYRELFLTQSPFLIGERFSYPFLINFISGLLIRGGVPFLTAFVAPSFIFSCATVGALFYFFKTIFVSRKVAVIASLIFLLNGGLGIFYFIADIQTSPSPWQTLLNPPHEYTRIDEEGIKWLSIIDSMIIPQRAFALGFPLTLVALALLYQYFFRNSHKKWQLVVAGVLLGFMPIIHTHSFLAAGIILSFWLIADLCSHRKAWQKRLPPWIGLVVLSGFLATPLYLYFFMNQVSHFLQWYPGWLARDFEMNWLIFWLKNWSITPILGAVGYISFIRISKLAASKAVMFFPFLALFMVANLWLFQPFAWDNTKLIVWSSVGISGLVGWLLVTKFTTLINKSLITFLFLLIISSGAVDAYRILRFDLHRYQIYSAEELELSEWVKVATDPQAIWLTGAQHNHWLFNLTGRQAVMTYPGWLWTHGYEYTPMEQKVRAMYQKPSQLTYFRELDVRYVVVGPQESQEMLAKPEAFRPPFQLVKKTRNYQIFELPQP